MMSIEHEVPDDGIEGVLATALMDAIECGLIACEADGAVFYLNQAAKREISSGRALRVERGVLQVNGPGRDALRDAITAAATRRVRQLLWAGEGAMRVMVATMPVLPANTQGGAKALVLLGRRSLCSPLGLEMLALRHRLTLSEKRVLSALIDTREPRQIAYDHGVQLSTVRTQIQAIRDKIGARNVDELLLRVAQVPAMAASFS
jgi:DNA-binding CsgD family transcriptional regulator